MMDSDLHDDENIFSLTRTKLNRQITEKRYIRSYKALTVRSSSSWTYHSVYGAVFVHRTVLITLLRFRQRDVILPQIGLTARFMTHSPLYGNGSAFHDNDGRQ